MKSLLQFLRIGLFKTKERGENVLGLQAAFLFLLMMVACVSPHSEGNQSGLQVTMKLKQVSGDRKLSVFLKGSPRSWDTDTLAILSWWDAQGKVQTQAVSVADGWETERKSIGKGYKLICSQPSAGVSFQLDLTVKGDVLTASVPLTGIMEEGEVRLKSIRLLPGFGAAVEGEEGYMVIPKDVGLLCNFRDKEPGKYEIPVYGFNNCNMPLFGIVRGESGCAAIITSGQFDAKLNVALNTGVQGVYSIDPVFTFRSFAKEERLAENISVEYHFLGKEEAGWLGIAKKYRNYNTEYRKLQPLRERVKNSPELAYSAEALEVRMRMGVKPVPTPVLEQTPENEPPIRTFLTFQKMRDIFDEFHVQGIDKTEFCIVGWHSGGHDGRFPQLFPVEETFGGEAELRKSIAHGQSLGYQIVSHDCYEDSYRISKDWSVENVRKKPDGQLWKGSQYAGGQSYNLCRIQAYENFAKRDEPRVRDLGFKGVHYNDVLSIVGPNPCYDPKHPATRRQDAEASNKILALSKEIFGGVQSEGPLDFAATVLDRVLYIRIHLGSIKSTFTFNPLDKSAEMGFPYADEIVPLYPAVYHGTMLYNIWNDCVNTGPGNKFYLKNIEYGGMPVAYFYGHFWLDPDKNWLGERDLRYDNKEGLQKAVESLRPVYDDLQKIKHLQMEFIEGHSQLATGVFETVYSNGERVVVNYTDTPYRVATGEEVPANGFGLLQKINM
jgi:hypothetical protein